MNQDERDEYADYKYDEMIDERLLRNVCIGCEGPMPAKPELPYSRPARCPICRPAQWESYGLFLGNQFPWHQYIGEEVEAPNGFGKITGVNGRGFPMVNEVAVTWARFLNWRG